VLQWVLKWDPVMPIVLLVLLKSTRQDQESFISYVNSFHPAFEFTWEISEVSVTFLDISVSITDNRLSTTVFYKPTDSHSYLLYSSSHPKHTLDFIPFSQFLRLRHLCSNDVDFSNKCLEMRYFFLRRGYLLAIVNRALHKASSIDRKTVLTPKPRIAVNDRIPFTLTFHPINNSIKPIINRNFNLLHSDLTTADIFNQQPLCSFKRAHNLQSFLVKGTLHSEDSLGTFHYYCK